MRSPRPTRRSYGRFSGLAVVPDWSQMPRMAVLPVRSFRFRPTEFLELRRVAEAARASREILRQCGWTNSIPAVSREKYLCPDLELQPKSHGPAHTRV